MGGMNHQPCKHFLVTSTRMSRFASLAFAHFELSNVALEDLLLAELKGDIGSIEKAVDCLEISRQNITQLVATIKDLEEKMDREEYQDLLEVRPINLDAVGASLVDAGMVEESAWKTVSKNALSGGFYKNLAVFQEQSTTLGRYTDRLIEKMKNLREPARNGSVTDILEKNLDGNLKPEFAKLYNAWGQFQSFFLASSMLSTEVYYAFNRYGSLTNRVVQSEVA